MLTVVRIWLVVVKLNKGRQQASKLYEYSGQQAKQDHLCLLLGTAVCRSIVRGMRKVALMLRC